MVPGSSLGQSNKSLTRADPGGPLASMDSINMSVDGRGHGKSVQIDSGMSGSINMQFKGKSFAVDDELSSSSNSDADDKVKGNKINKGKSEYQSGGTDPNGNVHDSMDRVKDRASARTGNERHHHHHHHQRHHEHMHHVDEEDADGFDTESK